MITFYLMYFDWMVVGGADWGWGRTLKSYVVSFFGERNVWVHNVECVSSNLETCSLFLITVKFGEVAIFGRRSVRCRGICSVSRRGEVSSSKDLYARTEKGLKYEVLDVRDDH
jgi:hypothetical protein